MNDITPIIFTITNLRSVKRNTVCIVSKKILLCNIASAKEPKISLKIYINSFLYQT